MVEGEDEVRLRLDLAALVVAERGRVEGHAAPEQVLLEDGLPRDVREPLHQILDQRGTAAAAHPVPPSGSYVRLLTVSVAGEVPDGAPQQSRHFYRKGSCRCSGRGVGGGSYGRLHEASTRGACPGLRPLRYATAAWFSPRRMPSRSWKTGTSGPPRRCGIRSLKIPSPPTTSTRREGHAFDLRPPVPVQASSVPHRAGFLAEAQATRSSAARSTPYASSPPASSRSASSATARPSRASSLPWEPARCGVTKAPGRS